jgi:glutathione peroxidase
MTFKQKLLKFFYPQIMRGSKQSDKGKVMVNKAQVTPPESIYDFEVELNDGQKLALSQFRNKRLLIVNTASDCGFTGQFDELQRLHEQRGNELAVIGFPANDFREQEKGSDAEIAQFCKRNYGVTFPLAKKGSVIRANGQQDLFSWLSSKQRNGWCDQEPVWNFSKYLVDEQGRLSGFYGPAVSPGEIPAKV